MKALRITATITMAVIASAVAVGAWPIVVALRDKR